MIKHGSKEFYSIVNDIMHEEKLTEIILKTGANDAEQLKKNIAEVIVSIYRNPEYPQLFNIYTTDDAAMIYKNAWEEVSLDTLYEIQYMQLQQLFKKIQKPFSYYVDFDSARSKLLEDDPLKLMKHLDAFVNGDDGYGWDDARLVDKNTIDIMIKSILFYNNEDYAYINEVLSSHANISYMTSLASTVSEIPTLSALETKHLSTETEQHCDPLECENAPDSADDTLSETDQQDFEHRASTQDFVVVPMHDSRTHSPVFF